MYASQDRLIIRSRTHDIYSYPKINFPEWVISYIPWQGDERVLDIGCGAGLYFDPVRIRLDKNGYLIAADLSYGMLKDLKSSKQSNMIPLLNANATRIPFVSNSFDVVLANHMLYYVQDIRKAVRNIRRILRPRGYFIAATNSRHSMNRFQLEITESLSVLGYKNRLPTQKTQKHFTLESGADIIRPFFPNVQIKQIKNALIFPNTDPVLAYINSLQPSCEPLLPPYLSWEDLLDQIGIQISKKIQKEGKYTVPKITGVFIAENEG
jgi:ubiquinone/menaquinone biosynthesis C-methylase UbiE